MFQEDRSLLNEASLDAQVLRIVRATNFKPYRGDDGKAFFGYAMGDGSYLKVSHDQGIDVGAIASGWRAGRIDADGNGIQIVSDMNMHDAMVQTFKIPTPIYDVGNGPQVASFEAEDEVEAKSLLAGLIVEPAQAPMHA